MSVLRERRAQGQEQYEVGLLRRMQPVRGSRAERIQSRERNPEVEHEGGAEAGEVVVMGNPTKERSING